MYLVIGKIVIFIDAKYRQILKSNLCQNVFAIHDVNFLLKFDYFQNIVLHVNNVGVKSKRCIFVMFCNCFFLLFCQVTWTLFSTIMV